MREVLTNSPPLPENFLGGGADASGFGIEAEILEDALSQILQSLPERPSRSERQAGVRRKLGARPDSRRFKRELIRFEGLRTTIIGQRSCHNLPGGQVFRPGFRFFYDYLTAGLHH